MALSSLLSELKVLNKIKPLNIDNGIFQLHYRVTVIILFGFSFVISAKQFFGDPIHCTEVKDKLNDVINSYCWVHGTYTLQNQQAKEIVGIHSAHAGVRSHMKNDYEVNHSYYQWVCILLVLQALFFYAPRYIWRHWEGGRIKTLTAELDRVIVDTSKWNEARKSTLVKYFTDANCHTLYALRFAVCELLNFINVVGQIILLHKFIGASFTLYGPAIASFYYHPLQANSTDPMALAFPKVAKCTFRYFGPSGSIQTTDSLCILPLNVINEKVFAVLWFWFMILAVLSGIVLIYRLAIFSCPYFRYYSIRRLLCTIPNFQSISIVSKFSIGDWFVLYQLGKNLHPKIFKDLVLELACECDKKTVLI